MSQIVQQLCSFLKEPVPQNTNARNGGLIGLAGVGIALMDGFGLTRREAELTALLACGSSLTDAAPALGMSRETARHHLKQIFQKTDTHRQAQLVALVSREA